MATKSQGTGKRFELPLPMDSKDGDAPFAFVNPGGGEVFEVGSKVKILWSGGPADVTLVNLLLVDNDDWVVVLGIGHVAYKGGLGEYTWQIPTDFPHVHTHNYLLYIEDAIETDGRYTRTTWTYGPLFKIH